MGRPAQTLVDESRFAIMARHGLSNAELAEEFGCSVYRVEHLKRKLSLTKRRHEPDSLPTAEELREM